MGRYVGQRSATLRQANSCVQAELDKERDRSKAETATRDSKIAGLFDELAAAQSEMHEARAAVDQVGAHLTENSFRLSLTLILTLNLATALTLSPDPNPYPNCNPFFLDHRPLSVIVEGQAAGH